MKVVLIKINARMAQAKNIPVIMAGVIERETPKAYKIQAQGISLVKSGICSICGTELTDPNSIKLGIGPICAANKGIPVLSGYTKKDIAGHLEKIKYNGWLPKSCVTILEEKRYKVRLPKIEIKKAPPKPPKYIEEESGKLKIFFDFDYRVLTGVKALDGRRFHKTPRPHWSCPDTLKNRIKLEKLGFPVKLTKEEKKKSARVRFPDFPGHLDKILYPYQKDGVRFLFEKEGLAIIGDEMGLGKTIQALTYIEMEPKIKTALIVCPASLKLNWAAECRKWMTDFNLYILSGKKADNLGKFQVNQSTTAQKNIIIINYDVLRAWSDYLIDFDIDVMVLDECHFFKNQKAQRTKAVKMLAKGIKRIVPLSGTPIINRPIEFFNALNLVNSGVFSSYWAFARRYCGAYQDRFGWNLAGATNLDELNELVQDCMIRRKKEDVLTELPPKVRVCVPVEIQNYNGYIKEVRSISAWIKSEIKNETKKQAKKIKKAQALIKMGKMQHLSWEYKKSACLSWVKDYLETEDKLVLFGCHKTVLDFFEKEFKGRCVRIDGSVSMDQRDKAVNAFQKDPKIKLFLGNIKAAGTGLTLTAAKATVFMEFGWTPGEHDQAEDRVHRIGQTADSVTAFYLCGVDTIDMTIMELLDEKREVISKVLDGESVQDFNFSKALEKALLAA